MTNICICQMCDRPFHPTRNDARFCSQACKQKAYRRRVDPDVGTTSRERQRQTNIRKTKYARTKELVCAGCGRDLVVSIAHTNLVYCSQACKQKAYRQRKLKGLLDGRQHQRDSER